MTHEKHPPHQEEWGDINDRDVYSAYELFFGKDNNSMQPEFQKNMIMRCFDLRAMPINVFKYYIFSLKAYVETGDCDELDLPDSASHLLELVMEKSEAHAEEMKSIYPALKELLDHIANNQDKYDADIDIYGDFKEINKRITTLLGE